MSDRCGGEPVAGTHATPLLELEGILLRFGG